MSVLSSTNTGRKRVLTDYFEKMCNTQKNISYFLKEDSNSDYIAVIKSKLGIIGTTFTINCATLPCKIDFGDRSYPIFEYAITEKDYEKIPKFLLYNNSLFNYEFRSCTFYPELFLFAEKHAPHISNSIIYIPSKPGIPLERLYGEKRINIVNVISKLLKSGNKVFVQDKWPVFGLHPNFITDYFTEIKKEDFEAYMELIKKD